MRIFTLTLYLLIFSFTYSIAQSYDFLNAEWKRLTANRNIQINPLELEVFIYTGEKVEKSEVMNYLAMLEYMPALYIDDKNNPKALVFEKATEEVMQSKIELFESAPGSDFMIKEFAPDFRLNNLEGNQVNLSDLKGEVVLLNFWFVGCKPCIMEMPELNELVEEFESQGVNFLAIGLDNPERISKFLEKHQFSYNLLPNGRRVANQYKISSYPTHLLLDRDGKVIFSQQGYFPGLKYALSKRLNDALKD